MKDAEVKLAALKFANDMCAATRAKTIEECAKVAEQHAREATGHTEEQSAAEQIAEAIRSLKDTP